MLKFYVLALLTAAVFELNAQTVLTSAYFPAVGDTLRYSRAAGEPTLDLTAGAAVDWDFGTIEVASDFDEVVSAVPDDSPFPMADVVVESTDSTRNYYSVSDSSFSLVGLSGDFAIFQALDLAAPVVPALPQRYAPLAFGDTHSANSTVQVVVSTDSLPTPVVEQFGTALSGIDSLRLTAMTDRQFIVDGYGTLTLNDRTYTVVRERRTEIMDNQIEARTGFLGYTNVTGLLSPLLPDLGEFLGQQPPQTTYFYWSPDHKEAIARVTVDENGSVMDMSFIRADVTNSVGGPSFSRARVMLYPNPANLQATLSLEGLDPGTYTLRVVNVMGRQVASQQFSASAGAATLELDVSQLPRGTYLYSVTNERGRMLATKRLLVGG